MISKEHKAKAAVGKKVASRKVLGRTGGADLTSKPDQKLVSKSRFGKVVNGGHMSAFTSQSVDLSHPKASKHGDALKPTRKPQVTQYKRIGGKRRAGESGKGYSK